jgi:hypothetical protein
MSGRIEPFFDGFRASGRQSTSGKGKNESYERRKEKTATYEA